MPTLFHDFEGGLNTRGWVTRDDRWRCIHRDARGSCPLGIFMIKKQSMIMVRRRGGSQTSGHVRETWRSDAHRQKAQCGDAHD